MRRGWCRLSPPPPPPSPQYRSDRTYAASSWQGAERSSARDDGRLYRINCGCHPRPPHDGTIRSGFLVSLRKVRWGAFSSSYSRRRRRRRPAAGTPPPSHRTRRGDVVVVVVRVADVCLIEVGGTVGDIESSVFLEAFRQFQFRVGPVNFCLTFVSLSTDAPHQRQRLPSDTHLTGEETHS
jgi:hypothetical protein